MESVLVDRERLSNVLLISFVLELEGFLEKVYGHLFSLLLLPKYADKWSHTWRENDECEKRWNKKVDFLILYIYTV